MKEYYNLKEMLCKELKEYDHKNELSAGSLDVIHKLTDTLKNLYKIEMLDDSGYSYGYDDDDFGRERRHHHIRRHDDGYGMRYSYDDGMEHFKNAIREMMNYAKNDQEREAYRRVLKVLEDE